MLNHGVDGRGSLDSEVSLYKYTVMKTPPYDVIPLTHGLKMEKENAILNLNDSLIAHEIRSIAGRMSGAEIRKRLDADSKADVSTILRKDYIVEATKYYCEMREAIQAELKK